MTRFERLESGIDAVDIFRRLAWLPHVVFFDSATRDSPRGRYSFIAADPIAWWEAPAARSKQVWDDVAQIASRLGGDQQPELPPFQGGLAGMFGYELAGCFEPVPMARIDDLPVPAIAVGWYDVVVAFDHAENAAWIISQGWPEADPAARRERAESRLRQFQEWIAEGEGRAGRSSVEQLPPLPASQLALQHAVGIEGVTSNLSADGYRAMVQRAIEYIYAGDVFQVNLAQRILHAANGSAVDLYCRLRDRNPAPMAGYLDGGGWQICSASPERFLRVDDGRVETRPIKGTTVRTGDRDADLTSGRHLQASAKDRAENVMIVDLLRNDLSRACRPESVHVSQLCGLESYAWVQHLVSVVEGTLRDDQTPLDLLRHCFPGGSVTGAPKLRAMEIIAELEPTVRGAYCGSLGYLSTGGQMDASILIRTITASRGWWQLPVGGGIVADSDPEREYQETWQKATGMLRALNV